MRAAFRIKVLSAIIFSLPFLFYIVKLGFIDRIILEAIFLLAALLFVLLSRSIFSILLVLYIFIIRLLDTHSLLSSVIDLGGIGILIYSINNLIDKSLLIKYIKFNIFFITAIGIYSFYNNDYVDYFRIGGAFPSSMHYGFITAGLAIAYAIVAEFSISSLIYFSFLGISAGLSGSRASALAVISSLMYFLVIKKKFMLINFIFVAIFFIYYYEISEVRSISYNDTSDSIRINGWLDWLNRITIWSFLFGIGRYMTGSVGNQISEGASIITESSILSFIESYGFITCIMLFIPFLNNVKESECKYKYGIIIIFFLLAMASPFLETPSILLFNSMVISLALNSIKNNDRV